jgi:hypothetical protein
MSILLAVFFNFFANKRLKRHNQSFAGERVEHPFGLDIGHFLPFVLSPIYCRLIPPRFHACKIFYAGRSTA